MNFVRNGHMATLLPNGKVLLATGSNGTAYTNTAELYDPAPGTFTPTGNMNSGRNQDTITLLPNGKVLIAGGYDGTAFLNTAELFDLGLGFADARRPVVSSITTPFCQPGTLSLAGLLFTVDSEGSSGATNSSNANAPMIRLQRVDSDPRTFVSPQTFSASSFFSATLSNMASGHYRASVVSNAVPSTEKVIEIATTPSVGSYATTSVNLNGSVGLAPSSLPAGYKSLGTYPYSEPVAAGGMIKAIHLTEMRTTLDQGRAALLLPAITYTSPGNAGSLIRAIDLNEVRIRAR